MNTNIISHRMFVAALTHDGHAPDKPSSAIRSGEGPGPADGDSSKPPPQTLAGLAVRPWVNWPFRGWGERPAS